MFQGSSALLLDAKGRMTVPAKHRDALHEQSNGQLTITRDPDGCLLLIPRPVWVSRLGEISRLAGSQRVLKRMLLGSACDVEMDGTGRILIPPELRAAAMLEKEVMLLGMGSVFEIWDAKVLQDKEREDIAAAAPGVIADFSF